MTAFLRRLYEAIKFVAGVRSALAVRAAGTLAVASDRRVGLLGPAPDELPAVDPPALGVTLNADVIRVIDGDTVEVETKLRHTIRLLDCWAPETRLGNHTTAEDKAKGLAAKEYLRALLRHCNNRVRVHLPGNGGRLSDLTTLSRVLGRLWRLDGNAAMDDADVSQLMVWAGHAKATKEKTC